MFGIDFNAHPELLYFLSLMGLFALIILVGFILMCFAIVFINDLGVTSDEPCDLGLPPEYSSVVSVEKHPFGVTYAACKKHGWHGTFGVVSMDDGKTWKETYSTVGAKKLEG